jgi:succinate dehydrogenase / fumarate reductase flavoprotein subunit
MSEPRFIVVGGGLAGLMTTIKLCEAGHRVDLFSVTPVKRSHSVCAQGGINGAVNIKGENDSPELHFVDSVKGGDFLANQPLVKGMCYAAPGIIYLLDRMGVTFNRTPEGNLDFRRFGGTLFSRTAFAGATTGQQMLYALDEQVRRYEAEGLVRKFEYSEYLGSIRDAEGVCRGIVALDLRTMAVQAFRGDGTFLATGGPGMLFGRTTNSVVNTGSAAAAAYIQGAKYANGEFIQVHPTAIPGEDKLRLISESVRGEGGRCWVPRKKGDARPPREIPDADRLYFFEEKYPRYGNLVPRDIASREIHDLCVNKGLGVDGKLVVYLDVTHIPAETLDRKLGGVLEIYEKFVGDDPREVPMRIAPAVHYSMGGLWIDYEAGTDGFPKVGSPRNHQTNIPGLFAVGECDYEYHGGNRLGANSLLSCVYAGILGGPAGASYAKGLKGLSADLPSGIFDEAERHWRERFERIRKMSGKENPYILARDLGETMNANATIVRENKTLKETDDRILEMMKRWRDINTLDTAGWGNMPVPFVNQLWNMMELARVVVLGALHRDESRGSHYKPEKPQRDDANWLKTTITTWSKDGPQFTYDKVDTSLISPVARKYD